MVGFDRKGRHIMTRYYLDTEFNGMGGDLISMALVEEGNTRLLYLATDCLNPVPWVLENVLPVINTREVRPIRVKPDQFASEIQRFLARDSDPVIIADWPDDIKYFCQCLIVGPGQMIDIPAISFEVIRVDAYPTKLHGAVQHNALWDALALRFAVVQDRIAGNARLTAEQKALVQFVRATDWINPEDAGLKSAREKAADLMPELRDNRNIQELYQRVLG